MTRRHCPSSSSSSSSIDIALIDSGVDPAPHSSLASAVVAHYDVTSSDRTIPIKRISSSVDPLAHGTAVAGIIHRHAPAAQIHSIRILDPDRSANTAGKLIRALAFAIDQRFPVVNLSLGIDHPNEYLRDLCAEAFDRGILLLAAAANYPGRQSYPAAFPTVLGVDHDHFDDPLAFRYDPALPIELTAHGVYVEAPVPGKGTGKGTGGTRLFTGASFACAHITALATAWRLRNPASPVPAFRTFLAEAALELDPSRAAHSSL